jgi:hypothetical protein
VRIGYDVTEFPNGDEVVIGHPHPASPSDSVSNAANANVEYKANTTVVVGIRILFLIFTILNKQQRKTN